MKSALYTATLFSFQGTLGIRQDYLFPLTSFLWYNNNMARTTREGKEGKGVRHLFSLTSFLWPRKKGEKKRGQAPFPSN